MADQLSLREDFDAVCDQVEKNNRRKSSIGNASLASLSPSSVPSRDGKMGNSASKISCINKTCFSLKLFFEIIAEEETLIFVTVHGDNGGRGHELG